MGTKSRSKNPGAFGKKQFVKVVTQEKREKEVLELIKGVPTMITKIEMVDVPHIIGVVRPNRHRVKAGTVLFRRKGFKAKQISTKKIMQQIKEKAIVTQKQRGFLDKMKGVFQRKAK